MPRVGQNHVQLSHFLISIWPLWIYKMSPHYLINNLLEFGVRHHHHHINLKPTSPFFFFFSLWYDSSRISSRFSCQRVFNDLPFHRIYWWLRLLTFCYRDHWCLLVPHLSRHFKNPVAQQWNGLNLILFKWWVQFSLTSLHTQRHTIQWHCTGRKVGL